MSTYFRSLALLCLIITMFTCTQEVPPAYAEAIETVRGAYAPDRRVARFDIEPVYTDAGIELRGETNLPLAHQDLLDRLAQAQLGYIDSIQILPHPTLGGQKYGIVRQSVANLRSDAKHSAELATQAILGTPLKVYKKQDNWYLVQTPDGYISWLDSGGFALRDETTMEGWRNSDRIIYTQEYGMAYTRPNSAAFVGDLVAGAILETTATEGDYYVVRYPDGRVAYVPQAEAQPLPEWANAQSLAWEDIFNTAERQMGRPYLWGGTSGKGMDCSGFTKTILFRHGLIIPRDASQQVHTGTEVATDTTLTNLAAGDFLFFGNYREDGSRRVTHVGLHLGEGRFIHSGADNGAVAIQSLRREDSDFAENRLGTFLGARRLLDDQRPGDGLQPIATSDWYF